jgi:ParB-like chromosome segregation protein Spo0J
MKIEQIKTADLIPYARNSRTHSDAQVAQIAGSIREFGFTNPVLIDAENGIIAGHGRVLAAGKLGMESVPCIRLTHLTEPQRRAYIIADNKLALNAGWDEEMLGVELADLREMDFDLDLTGFDADEIERALNPPERDDTPPEDFGEVDENIDTEHECPKCGYRWSGKSGGKEE